MRSFVEISSRRGVRDSHPLSKHSDCSDCDYRERGSVAVVVIAVIDCDFVVRDCGGGSSDCCGEIRPAAASAIAW